MSEDLEALRKSGWVEKYGCLWSSGLNEAAIEQFMFLGKNGEHSASGFGGPDKEGVKFHFRQFCSLVFSHEKCNQPFEWNPNALEILDAYFEGGNTWTCIAGHGSSSKSRTIAAIAVADFLMNPSETSCLITSTTLPDGKRRVWADVERFWFDAGVYFGGEDKLPGELVHSIAIIRYLDRETGRVDEARGLALIPSGNDDDAKAGISKMIGFKSPRLRLFIDEASHISWKVVEAAESNLTTGGVDFRVMATLNPNTKTDTGGKLCCPVDENGKPDWKAVDTTTLKRWQNERGITIRLSGEESPNVKLARDGKCAPHDQPWSGLLSLKVLEDQRERLAPDNFNRQYLAIWPETEAIETIYSDQEIRHHGGHHKVQQRAQLVAKVKGFDPSWTHGGDGAPLVFIDLVRDETGRMVAEFSHWEMMDEGLDPTKDKSIQLQDKLAGRLNQLQVQGKDFGIDITGGGRVIDDNVRVKWPGSGRVGVVFNAAPSDNPVSALDPTPACEKYADLMTELWYFGKELLMSGQLKNLPERVIEELCARRKEDKDDKKGRIQIEETRKMKKRLGRSPDVANAMLIALYVAKVNHGLIAQAKPAKTPKVQETLSNGGFDFSRLRPAPKGGMRGLALKYAGLSNHSPTAS